MSNKFFTTTPNGKLDIAVTVYNENGMYLRHSSLTYDMIPTITEVIKSNFVVGAKRMEITTTPSYQLRNYKIINESTFKIIK